MFSESQIRARQSDLYCVKKQLVGKMPKELFGLLCICNYNLHYAQKLFKTYNAGLTYR